MDDLSRYSEQSVALSLYPMARFRPAIICTMHSAATLADVPAQAPGPPSPPLTVEPILSVRQNIHALSESFGTAAVTSGPRRSHDCHECSAPGEFRCVLVQVPLPTRAAGNPPSVWANVFACSSCGATMAKLADTEQTAALGRKSSFCIDPVTKSSADLERGVWKAGSAQIMIPELGLETASVMRVDLGGSGTYSTIASLLATTRRNIAGHIGAFGTARDDEVEIFCRRLDQMAAGSIAFTLVLVDPLGTSWIEGQDVETFEYERSEDENERLGLVPSACSSTTNSSSGGGGSSSSAGIAGAGFDVGTSFIYTGEVGENNAALHDVEGEGAGISMNAETADIFSAFCAHVQGMDPRGNGASIGLFPNDPIEVLWPPENKWYPAVVLAPRPGTLDSEGTISVLYFESGEMEIGVCIADRVRKRKQQ